MQSDFETASVRRHVVIAAAAFMVMACVPPVCAQAGNTPQPGSLQNEGQRLNRYYERARTDSPETLKNPLPEQSVPGLGSDASAQPAGEARFVLAGVEFTYSAFLDPAELDAAVAPFVGKAVSRGDLKSVLDAVNALYAARGITTARAMLQNQTIVGGVVHIDLVEGRLGTLRVEGTRHLNESFVRRRIRLMPGDVVDSGQLRADLVFLNRTTDIDAQALLKPGTGRGETDVLIHVDEPDRRSVDVFVDSNGSESTGRARVGLLARLYGLAGADDRLDGNFAHSRGGNDGAVSYSIPVSQRNSRIGVSYAHSQINIVNDAFRDLDITGSSSSASLEYREPFIATLDYLFGGIGSYSFTRSATQISGTSVADTTGRAATVGLSVEHRGEGRRWSVTQLLTRLQSDEPLLGESLFGVAPGSASYMQRIGRSRWALRADAGWQWSLGKNVPSASLFQIGGLSSVRGYERGVLAGPRGYYLDLELHRSFGDRLDLFAFADHGATLSFYPQRKQITGAGLGLNYQRGWLSVSGDAGYAFDTVVPEQKRLRFDLRVSARWN